MEEREIAEAKADGSAEKEPPKRGSTETEPDQMSVGTKEDAGDDQAREVGALRAEQLY